MTVPGKVCSPVRKAEMYPTGCPGGVIDVKFKEYADEDGMPQFD
jgi:hypothetical protein